MPRFHFSLLAKFSIIVFVLLAAIGAAMAWSMQQQLEENMLQQEAESAADQVATILDPYLRSTDLSEPLKPARYAQIDTLIREDILRQHIVRVKIWNRDGVLLYSDEKDLVGQRYPIAEELQNALKGSISTDISSLNKPENASERPAFSRLLEVYVPLHPMNSPNVMGAYEIYHDLTVLEPRITEIQHSVWISVAIGFLVLYLSLFTLVRGASRELIQRNAENVRLYQQEQTRRAELSALYDLSRSLADAVDNVDDILGLATHQAVETCHVTFARIALLQEGEYVVRSAFPARVLDRELRLGQREPAVLLPFFQRVLEQNTPVVLSATSPELNDRERGMLFMGFAQSQCIVPLRAGNRVLGLLMLGEQRGEERESFIPEKIRLARSIGDQAGTALERVELFAELENAYVQTVLALANAIDAKDTYTADHAHRLAEMALEVGRQMRMSRDELEALRYGAILHDIGKIGVPDAILQKPSKLDADEWVRMRQHPVIGAQILAPVAHLASAAEIVRHHHERYDGKGYPDGLAGDAISLGARILTVVDSFSAIMDKRVYKGARSQDEAIAELRRHAGSQFDPRIVRVFLAELVGNAKEESAPIGERYVLVPS